MSLGNPRTYTDLPEKDSIAPIPLFSFSSQKESLRKSFGKYSNFFTWADSDRGNSFKLKGQSFKLDVKNKFFTVRIESHGHTLSKELVDTPSPEMFKARLDGALSKLI